MARRSTYVFASIVVRPGVVEVEAGGVGVRFGVCSGCCPIQQTLWFVFGAPVSDDEHGRFLGGVVGVLLHLGGGMTNKRKVATLCRHACKAMLQVIRHLYTPRRRGCADKDRKLAVQRDRVRLCPFARRPRQRMPHGA